MSITVPKNIALSDGASEPNGSQNGTDERLLAIVSDFSGLADLGDRIGEKTEKAQKSESVPVGGFSSESRSLSTLHAEIRQELDRIITDRNPPVQDSQPFELAAPVCENSGIRADGEPSPISLRSTQILQMRSELFAILSEDSDFPEYHAKTVLDIASKISERTVEEELRDVGSLLLYFVETLGVFFDAESASLENRGADSRRKARFISQLKDFGAESPAKFRVDFSNKPHAQTVKACLRVAFFFWKSLRTEHDAIQLQLAKIRGRALAQKIACIEAQFDFSDLERADDLEAARK